MLLIYQQKHLLPRSRIFYQSPDKLHHAWQTVAASAPWRNPSPELPIPETSSKLLPWSKYNPLLWKDVLACPAIIKTCRLGDINSRDWFLSVLKIEIWNQGHAIVIMLRALFQLAHLCDKGCRTFGYLLLDWLAQCYASSVKVTAENCIRKGLCFTVSASHWPGSCRHTDSFPMSTCKFIGLRLWNTPKALDTHWPKIIFYFLLQPSPVQKVDFPVFPNTENGFSTSSTCLAPPWILQSRIYMSASPGWSSPESWAGGCSISVLGAMYAP